MITIEPPRTTAAPADAWTAWGLSRPALTRFANRAQAAVGLLGDVEILLTTDPSIRRLNKDFRGKNKPTDVLSFPAPEGFGDDHAGDLAVSLDTAQRQATEHGHTLDLEVRILLLHGLLHLHGMDHEVDKGEMATRESELRSRMKLPLGLIGRASQLTPRKKSLTRKKSTKIAKTSAKKITKARVTA